MPESPMNASPSQPEFDVVIEQLVAYLDGELDPEAARRIEQRLASDPAFRARLQQLQRTWDLLDDLPRSEATSTFTRSTVEMVAVQAENDLRSSTNSAWLRPWIVGLVGIAGVCVAALLGYQVSRSIWPSADEALLRDLPVVERVDVYLHAGNVEFLRTLQEEGLFVEEPNHAP